MPALRRFTLLPFAVVAACTARTSPRPSADEWPAYGRDALGSRFSPLADIHRGNVRQLAPAGTYHTGEPLPTADRRRSLEPTPILVGGVLYLSTPLGKVIALEDRKSTRLNSSHLVISYAVFCLKKTTHCTKRTRAAGDS